MKRKELVKSARRIVVKVGTRVITHPDGTLDEKQIHHLAAQVSGLKEKGLQVIIVSSGAIGAGMAVLGLKKKPRDISGLQACAAVGQGRLIENYTRAFSKRGYITAQILLTADDLRHRARFLNARNTVFKLLDEGIIPVVNENDTVAIDEIKFGDNDRLSALVTNLAQADLLIILSDISGLYDKEGKVVHRVEKITREIEDLCGQTGSLLGTGGMVTKLEAARIVTRAGEGIIIANGRQRNILKTIFKPEIEGTFFDPHAEKLTARKRWLAFFTRPRGEVVVDKGAQEALAGKGKSLLARGIVAVGGNFQAGDAVDIVVKGGKKFACGLVNYNSEELAKIKGVNTACIHRILGYKKSDEIIHRNNMFII